MCDVSIFGKQAHSDVCVKIGPSIIEYEIIPITHCLALIYKAKPIQLKTCTSLL